MRHRVLILGGGFGGLYAARTLGSSDVDVTLIDRRNFHLFQPLLYQVATGSLSPGDISAPLRGILEKHRNVRVLLGEAADIDPVAHRVILKDGASCGYDTLIVATGSKTSYYGRDQWRAWAPSLKTVEEATAIRHKILYAFEAAERAPSADLRRAWLTFVIVGGGPTGVELAGALAEIAHHTLRDEFRAIRPEDATIYLVDGGPRILSGYPEHLSQHAEDTLTRLGVHVRCHVKVVDVDEAGVLYKSDGQPRERMPAKTVLWAGGVQTTGFGRTLAERTRAETAAHGAIRVNPDLTIPHFPHIFVVGDLASAPTPDGRPLPGVAQVAMQQGRYAAEAVLKRLKGRPLAPFRYFDKGELAVIGRGQAVARIFGAELWGLPAWLTWLFVHLMYLVQFQNRAIVFVQWGFQYLTWSRGARLITGPTVDAASTAGAENLVKK